MFGPADSAWHQGAAEVLVKAVKRAIKLAAGGQRLSSSELLTVFAEVANILNERPIGTLPTDDSEIGVLTPNILLLGRATARNPGGWGPNENLKGRMQVVENVVQHFWKEWTKLYAPTLVDNRKWKGRKPNLQPGDVVETYANVDHLQNEVGFKPATKLEDGIHAFVDWYRDYYKT